MNVFSFSLLSAAILMASTTAVKPVVRDAIMERLLLSSEQFFSRSEKRSVSTEDDLAAPETNCNYSSIRQLFSQLSPDCQNFLFDAATQYDFEEESSIMCESCGRTLYSILQCLHSGPTELEMFDVLCTENENGDACYRLVSGEGAEEDEVFAECGDMECSDECRRRLRESFAEYGCCLYSLVALNGSATVARDMWASCGLAEPGMCAPAFRDDSGTSDAPPPSDAEELPTDDEDESATEETSSSATSPPNTETSRETPAKTEASASDSTSSATEAPGVSSGPETTTEEISSVSTPKATTSSEETTVASSEAATAEAGDGERGADSALVRGEAQLLTVNYAISLVVPVLISTQRCFLCIF